MSFKDLFFKPDEEAPKLKAFNPPAPSATAMQAVMPQGVVTAEGVDEFTKYFTKVMDDNNIPGPDYYEFSKALLSMAAVGISEQQKYVVVFAGFAAQGIKAELLYDTAARYVEILETKKQEEFETALASAQASIDQKKARVDALVKENTDLTAKIQANTTDMMNLNVDITTQQGKLESKKTTFNMAFNNFVQKIHNDMEKIKTYLYGNATQ